MRQLKPKPVLYDSMNSTFLHRYKRYVDAMNEVEAVKRAIKKQEKPKKPVAPEPVKVESIFNPTENWKRFEASVKRSPALMLNDSDFVPEEKDIKSFIDAFINNYNKKYCTYIVKTKELYCNINRLRSFHDMWGLVKNYYPKTLYVDFMRAIFELASEKKIKGKWLCSTINRYVFSAAPHPTKNMYEKWENYTLRMTYVSPIMNIDISELFSCLGFTHESFDSNK